MHRGTGGLDDRVAVTPVPPGTACTVTAVAASAAVHVGELAAMSGWDFEAPADDAAGTRVGHGHVDRLDHVVGDRHVHEHRVARSSGTARAARPVSSRSRPRAISPTATRSRCTGTGFVAERNRATTARAIIPDGSTAQRRGTARTSIEYGRRRLGPARSRCRSSVERFLVVNDVGVVDCAQPGAACGIGATDFSRPADRR